MLEQQLKNEDNETIGTLSRAIKGARLRKWEISQECFNLVCRALQIPCDDGCNGSFQGKKFILVLLLVDCWALFSLSHDLLIWARALDYHPS